VNEQVLYTSDGLLTKATNRIPHKSRARRIVVTSRPLMNAHIEVEVIVGTTGKLVWRSDQPQMERSEDGQLWVGGIWIFTDASTYYSLPFVAGDMSRGVSTQVAANAKEASVEQLRGMLNYWLNIRPVITFDVCELVKLAINGKFKGAQAWRAIKSPDSIKEM